MSGISVLQTQTLNTSTNISYLVEATNMMRKYFYNFKSVAKFTKATI